MSLNRNERPMGTMRTIGTDLLEDKFARMTWFVTEFENNARRYYRFTELIVIDETLRIFYVSYKCLNES